MAQKNRSKEIWLVPKRVSLHQTICLIDGIIERKYDGTVWNPQKQNNLGVNLKKWGATLDGKNVAQQSIRTLVAAIPQYLGFVYINTDTTPNTICLTEAGMALWHKHKDELIKIPNLRDGKDSLITKSDCVLTQMEKLQITNPIINKDCENIYVFPFRFMLKILLRLKYLDKEEIAYFLFKVRNEDEVEVVVQEIENFRSLSSQKREILINAFKKTHIGNITLVKASSAGYFMSLCQITGIIDKITVYPENKTRSIPALRINEEYKDYVKEILDKKYNKAEVFDFADNLQLWIDYIGNPERKFPPISVTIKNDTNSNFLIQVYKENICKYDDLINANDVLQFPMFVNEEYNVKVIDINTGVELTSMDVVPNFESRLFEIHAENNDDNEKDETIEEIAEDIIEHCSSQNFSGKTLNYISTLNKVLGLDKLNDKSLRGAYFEYYAYKMLLKLLDLKVIDNVIWNGKIGKYGLPTQAPGGKTGTPDIIFTIDDTDYVLELTTIKSKSGQFAAEGSSVPDHIRLHKMNSKNNVVGIFCAPVIHGRNTNAMQSILEQFDIKLHCITEKDFINVLLTKNRDNIKNFLEI